ncbi:hypothetical protein HYV71_04030 [Candidatus Uhrbacteria bacterium]|nr:hypothetical protein [Candidatus Uhrbacteria bacterium]
MNAKIVTIQKEELYPLLDQRERRHIWERARGLWKRRTPDPIRELKKMRKEWERA